MRSDIVKIVNALAVGQGTDFEIIKAYNNILDYCKETKTRPAANDYKINGGALYINNIFFGRVAPLPKKLDYNEQFCFLNGKAIKNDHLGL